MMKLTTLFFVLLVLPFVSFGQVINETFDETPTASTSGGTGMPNAYSVGNYVLNSGTWALSNAIANTNVANQHSAPRALQLKSQVGTFATSPTIATGGLGTVSFWVCSTSAGGAVNVSWQINGGGFNANFIYCTDNYPYFIYINSK